MAIPFNLPSEEDTEEYYRRLDQLLADLYDVLRHILLRPRAHAQPNQHPPTREARGDDGQGGAEPHGAGGGGGDPGDGGGGGGTGAHDVLEQRLHPLPDLVADTNQTSTSSSTPPEHPQRPDPSGLARQEEAGQRHHHQRQHHRQSHPERNSRPPSRRQRSRRSSSPRKKPCCALKVSNTLKTSAENWVLVGQELRKIAEDFRTTAKTKERTPCVKEQRIEVKASNLFSLLVPPPLCGSVWTTVILLVGWRLLMRHHR